MSLKKDFLRTMVTIRADAGEGAEGDGKKPMGQELYLCLARWFFEMGTSEGLFAHCFLVLSWNLMCRANNMCRICFSHLSWDWNSLVIRFYPAERRPIWANREISTPLARKLLLWLYRYAPSNTKPSYVIKVSFRISIICTSIYISVRYIDFTVRVGLCPANFR